MSFSFAEEEGGLKATHSYTHSLQADCDCIHARCTVTAALFVSSQQSFFVRRRLAASCCRVFVLSSLWLFIELCFY